MSNFPRNLSILRRRAGYTQEALAEALGVSRQAVGKWECGQSLPEAATLLTLADLLGCTLDQLMREELEEDPAGAEGGAPEETGDAALFAAYNTHMDRFALMIAAGVALVLTGVAALLAAYTRLGESGFVAVPLLACVAAAVFLFVLAGLSYSDFRKAHPTLPLFYPPEELAAFRRSFRTGMAFCVAAILADVTLLVCLAVFFQENERRMALAAALFFLILAGAVGVIVFLGIQHSKYDPTAYAASVAEAERKDDPVSAAIMLTATAAFLLLGFLADAWHPGWVVFPVGGILCAIVSNFRGSASK